MPFPSPRSPGSMSGVPLQRMVIPPEGFLSMFGRQMHGPAVALSRSIRTQQRCRPNLETACPHLADRPRPFEDQAFELSSDFSVNRPRSRCHDAVTKAESHQARKRWPALWITWITCTSRRSRDIKFRGLDSSRIRHAMQPDCWEERYASGIDQHAREKGKTSCVKFCSH